MFLLELSFAPDDAERLAARPAHRAHLSSLKSAGTVVLAGPLADDSGAIIVLDVADRAAVDAIVAQDPYYALDGVRVVGLREWNPIPL